MSRSGSSNRRSRRYSQGPGGQILITNSTASASSRGEDPNRGNNKDTDRGKDMGRNNKDGDKHNSLACGPLQEEAGPVSDSCRNKYVAGQRQPC